MGKHGRSSRYKGYRKLPFTIANALGVLGEDDVSAQVVGQTLTEERRILSLEATHHWRDMTAGDGPIIVGVAHSDYTATEIEQALEATGAWDEGDLVSLEHSKRLVRRIGSLSEQIPTINDGNPVKIRLNWRIATGDGIQFWALNQAQALTTGSLVEHEGVLHTVLV